MSVYLCSRPEDGLRCRLHGRKTFIGGKAEISPESNALPTEPPWFPRRITYPPGEPGWLSTILHMPDRYERVRVGWHCAKVKGHVELKIETPRVKTFSYTISLNYTIPTPTVSVVYNVHLRQDFFKTVKVIERSHDVRPRSK